MSYQDPLLDTLLNRPEKKIANKHTQQQPEITPLSPIEEVMFQLWAKKSQIDDLDTGKYDYRGFYKANGPVNYRWGLDHLPDTWKQHGHPTFSQESIYSQGAKDGGTWEGDTFIEQPKMAVSHATK